MELLWKNEGGCVIRKDSHYFIDFEVENDQVGRWRYTGFYGCLERGRRRESWGRIRYLASKSELPWCIIGDFNDLIFSDETRGGREHLSCSLTGFIGTIIDCGLRDLGFVGEKYKWER